MRIFLAGVPGGGSSGDCRRERELNPLWHLRLWTYYWLLADNGKIPKKMNKVELFLDSGAFSAKSQGVSIDIKEYIQFIKDNESSITVYANLDVIGDPEATLKNQRIMEKAGLNPLPVYHFGSDEEKYLVPLIEKYEYICLGGMVKSGNLNTYLDRLFSKYICDEKGFPKVKVHGFGLTSIPLMVKYPWYSVDSTSWVVTGRMGSVFVPSWKNGKWNYDGAAQKISVSNKSPDKNEAGQHIDTLSPIQKRIMLQYINEKGYVLGKSEFKKEYQTYELKENEKWFEKKPADKNAKRIVEIIVEPGVSNKYQLRDEMNIIFFLDLEKSMPKWPWAFKTEKVQTGFF